METNEFRVICETDDNLYVEIFFNGESATVIFDKKTGEWEVEGDGYAEILVPIFRSVCGQVWRLLCQRYV